MTDIVERLRGKVPMAWGDEGFMLVDEDAVLCSFTEAADEIERLRGIVAYQESRLSVIGHLASRDEDKRVARLEAAIELIVQESNAMKQLKMATDALGRAVK